MTTLDKTKRIVANQTAMNFHNEAILTIAKYAKNLTAIKAIQSVITLQNFYGHQPLYLTQIRNDILENVFLSLSDCEVGQFKKVL